MSNFLIFALLLSLTYSQCAESPVFTLTPPVYVPPVLTINTTNGPVVGHTIYRSEVREWLGVRYAASTAGNNRFRPPKTPTPWTQPQPTVEWGNFCTQWNYYAPLPAQMIGSEDCLFVNIWSPNGAKPGTKKVVVIIHGGGQNSGSSGINLTEFGNIVIASQYGNGSLITLYNDVVTVSFNYRLNSFGFFTNPDLTRENYLATGRNSSGGYGTLDQIFLLKWVKNNIAKFGGNPHNVVIVGVSGGATAAAILVSSPLTRGLFNGAWIASPLTNHLSTQEVMEERYQDILEENLNCSGYSNTLSCLRGKSQLEIYNALVRGSCTGTNPAVGICDLLATNLTYGGVVNFPFKLGTPGPPIGGYILPYSPSYTLANKATNANVDLVVGNVNIEEIYAMYQVPLTRSSCASHAYRYAEEVSNLSPTDPKVVDWVKAGLDFYPDTQTGAVNCISDIDYTCSGVNLADSAAEGDRIIRRYVFEYYLDPIPGFFLFCLEGVCYAQHGDDNLFITGILDYSTLLSGNIPVKDDEYWLSQVIQEAIVTTSTGANINWWPVYGKCSKRDVRFNNPITYGNHYRSQTCGYWNNVTLFDESSAKKRTILPRDNISAGRKDIHIFESLIANKFSCQKVDKATCEKSKELISQRLRKLS